MARYNSTFKEFAEWALSHDWLRVSTMPPHATDGTFWDNWITPEGNSVSVKFDRDSQMLWTETTVVTNSGSN